MRGSLGVADRVSSFEANPVANPDTHAIPTGTRPHACTQIGGVTVRLRNRPPFVITNAREPNAEGVMLVPSET